MSYRHSFFPALNPEPHMSSVFHSSSSTQKDSIWRKLEKEVEIFLLSALMFLWFKKAISYHQISVYLY